ncbi:MAG: twin-arginine translocase TatA/TatE family subunit [Dermatophilaceae bacterium]
MLDINGWEFVVLVVVALLVIGPERLPEYSAKLAKMVRQLKGMADAATMQLREQMGPEFDNVDWKQYDFRQYDPRRIVREALMDDGSAADSPSSTTVADKAQSMPKRRDPNESTPYDEDAT